MTAQTVPAGAAQAAGTGRARLGLVASCTTCGGSGPGWRRVPTRDGGKILVEGLDEAGEWWAVTVNGQAVLTKPMLGEDLPESRWRYREHACQSGSADWGPCAGGCGTRVVLYGRFAKTLCNQCREVLEVWRALPGPCRGPIPYGKRVEGVYVPRAAVSPPPGTV